ncbi:hypothetical protein DFP72DRAFT_877540 [Ephemerocybe angulata]|uniref:Fe2OG dioxygenase domain-containing protein n=1 Tax=Ephemerocybe angulata TaxID=980116 RepID=A0A8H6MAG2_9AGAR|nr:hypothetical protein DFP72DRAFT_877540 [Tulosesus angulatus]
MNRGDSSSTSGTGPRDTEAQGLHVVIPALEGPSPDGATDSGSSDASYDSLFDQDASDEGLPPVALDVAPPIQGLYFDQSIRVPEGLAESVVAYCKDKYFNAPGANQVMLFGRAPEASLTEPPSAKETTDALTGFPPVLLSLLESLSTLLIPILPEETYSLLFPTTPTQARQAIINLYEPGEGITPHVDLLGRYDDGIVGVSFGSGSAMRFDKVDDGEPEDFEDPSLEEPARRRWDVYLPERSVIVLTEEARYDWTHGIDKRTRDYVCDPEEGGKWVDRGVRMSVTFRWMLGGADVLF